MKKSISIVIQKLQIGQIRGYHLANYKEYHAFREALRYYKHVKPAPEGFDYETHSTRQSDKSYILMVKRLS